MESEFECLILTLKDLNTLMHEQRLPDITQPECKSLFLNFCSHFFLMEALTFCGVPPVRSGKAEQIPA